MMIEKYCDNERRRKKLFTTVWIYICQSNDKKLFFIYFSFFEKVLQEYFLKASIVA